MIKIAKKLRRREQRRLQIKTEEAKKRGGVSASLFLEGEMNALTDADCFFFFGRRRNPKAILTVFFPDEERGEITVAEYEETVNGMNALFSRAMAECKRVKVGQLHTVRDPKYNFSFEKIIGVTFTYEWSEYILRREMNRLAESAKNDITGPVILQKGEQEKDGTVHYRLFADGEETAECRILPMEDGKLFYLYGLKTREEFRRKGMATCLLKEIAKEFAETDGAVLCLQVSSKNEPAERLYRKLGFRTEEERQYYRTEEN